MNADGKNCADGEERAKEVGAAIAEERKRHALRRQRLAYDAKVEYGLEENDKRHADHEEAPEPVGGIARNINRDAEERKEEDDYGYGEEKPELLGADGEDEVGMSFREVGLLLHRLA